MNTTTDITATMASALDKVTKDVPWCVKLRHFACEFLCRDMIRRFNEQTIAAPSTKSHLRVIICVIARVRNAMVYVDRETFECKFENLSEFRSNVFNIECLLYSGKINDIDAMRLFIRWLEKIHPESRGFKIHREYSRDEESACVIVETTNPKYDPNQQLNSDIELVESPDD